MAVDIPPIKEERSAFEVVMDILKGKETIDFDRPHHYEWIENKHLPITDNNYFQIKVIYDDI